MYAIKNKTTGEVLPERYSSRAMANVAKRTEEEFAATTSTTLTDIPKFAIVKA